MANLIIVFRNFANASKNDLMKEIRKLTGYIYVSKTVNEYNLPLIKTTIPMDNFCHY